MCHVFAADIPRRRGGGAAGLHRAAGDDIEFVATKNESFTDHDLAITFAAAMQASSDASCLLSGRALWPALCLRNYYDGQQEDSPGFLMRCLFHCLATKALFRGRFFPSMLECKHCGHRQFAGSHADEREFTTLQVYCADRNTHVCFDDLQSAMSSWRWRSPRKFY